VAVERQAVQHDQDVLQLHSKLEAKHAAAAAEKARCGVVGLSTADMCALRRLAAADNRLAVLKLGTKVSATAQSHFTLPTRPTHRAGSAAGTGTALRLPAVSLQLLQMPHG
jgi:hypothetical protein